MFETIDTVYTDLDLRIAAFLVGKLALENLIDVVSTDDLAESVNVIAAALREALPTVDRVALNRLVNPAGSAAKSADYPVSRNDDFGAIDTWDPNSEA